MPSVQARAGLAFVHLCRAGQGWVGWRRPHPRHVAACPAASAHLSRSLLLRTPAGTCTPPSRLPLGTSRRSGTPWSRTATPLWWDSKGKRGGEATHRTSTPCSLLLPAGRARQSAEPAPQTGQGRLGQPGPSLQLCFLGAGSLPRKENSPLSLPSSTGTHGEPDTGSVPSAGPSQPGQQRLSRCSAPSARVETWQQRRAPWTSALAAVPTPRGEVL